MIERALLKDLVIQVAFQQFGTDEFQRRELMDRVEQRVRAAGHWDSADDAPSGSVGLKSRGLAAIDWTITELKREQRLSNPAPDRWRVPARFWPELAKITGGSRSGSGNGVSPEPAIIRERLRRLASVTARVAGPPIPLDALRRENLYKDG